MLNIVMLTAYTEVDTCKKTNILSGLNVGNNYYYYNTFSLSIASYIPLY